MRRSSLIAGILLFGLSTIACSTADNSTTKTFTFPANESFPAFDTWIDIMENVIGPSFDEVLIVEATKDAEDMDLAEIARTAERAARYMALGHGVHQDKDVEIFGDVATACEAWFRRIDTQARAGDSAAVQKLIMKGEAQYCDRCHEATRP